MSAQEPTNENAPPGARTNDDDNSDDGSADGYIANEKSYLPMSRARCIALVLTVTGASFLNILSLQSAVIILPTISEDLGIPESRQQWVISSYTLTFGCFLLLWGRIADIFGKKLIFVAGSAFVVGAAANVPTAIGILGVTFPPGKAKNYAFSAYAAGSPLGAIFGNILSGLVSNFASWKWVFWVVAILATMVTAAGVVFIPPIDAAAKDRNRNLSLIRSVDWIGGGLITGGLVALLFALTEGNAIGWSTVWIYLLLMISALLITIFVAWQWYQEKHTSRAPLMKVTMFKNSRFSAAMLIMGLFFGVMNDFTIYATYFWQDYQGLSPLQTMLRFLPGGICGFIVAMIVARLISRVPTYLMLMFGEFTTAISCLLLASLPEEDQALGGALINASGQVGRAIGLALTTAIQTAVLARARGVPVEDVGSIEAWDDASLQSIRAANWFNFGLSLLCMVICGLAFRGTGIVGKLPDQPGRTGGEEGIMNEEDTTRP
ncbi:efflux transporter [Xylariales sp. PMI_506]|nr:efflux transporter [Xylariales sp. PMI_506]